MCGILVLNQYCMACYDRHIMFLLASILFCIATRFCLLVSLQAIIGLMAFLLLFLEGTIVMVAHIPLIICCDRRIHVRLIIHKH
jgi:hypothetical protein